MTMPLSLLQTTWTEPVLLTFLMLLIGNVVAVTVFIVRSWLTAQVLSKTLTELKRDFGDHTKDGTLHHDYTDKFSGLLDLLVRIEKDVAAIDTGGRTLDVMLRSIQKDVSELTASLRSMQSSLDSLSKWRDRIESKS